MPVKALPRAGTWSTGARSRSTDIPFGAHSPSQSGRPGPPPQFAIPSLGESGATPEPGRLALGAPPRRDGRDRAARVPGRDRPAAAGRPAGSRPAGFITAAAGALGVGLVAAPGYVEAVDGGRLAPPFFDFGAIVPLVRTTSSAVRSATSGSARAVRRRLGGGDRVDRPGRERRSGEELLAARCGRARGGGLAVPGARRPSRDDEAPRADARARLAPPGRRLPLARRPVGLLVLAAVPSRAAVAALTVVVPRFSRVAMGCVLSCSPRGRRLDPPPAASRLLWHDYGQAMIAKGVLLRPRSSRRGNMLRSRPRLVAAGQRPDGGSATARACRRGVSAAGLLARRRRRRGGGSPEPRTRPPQRRRMRDRPSAGSGPVGRAGCSRVGVRIKVSI